MQPSFPVSQNKNADPRLEKDLTNKISDAAIEVHRIPGPRLLESAYQVCMEPESKLRSIPFEHLVKLPLKLRVSVSPWFDNFELVTTR